jgi:hypothetical protein
MLATSPMSVQICRKSASMRAGEAASIEGNNNSNIDNNRKGSFYGLPTSSNKNLSQNDYGRTSYVRYKVFNTAHYTSTSFQGSVSFTDGSSA